MTFVLFRNVLFNFQIFGEYFQQMVRSNWTCTWEEMNVGTDLMLFTKINAKCPGEGNGNTLQYSCLENPMEGGAW